MREFVGDFYSLLLFHDHMHLHCSLEFYLSSAIEVSSLFWDRRVRLVRLGDKSRHVKSSTAYFKDFFAHPIG